jgi:predicted dehydrogenase
MTKRVKAGLIGAGFISHVHLEALRRLGYVDVLAIAEANQELAEAKAKQLNIPRAYGDYRDLLADEDIEVVHNCTPNYMHYEISKLAIESGKHIVSEKPLAMTSEESSKLVELVQEEGVINAIDFNYRFYPLVQQMRGMISQGQLGNIYLAHGCYLQDWLLFDTDYNWRIEADKGGARAMWHQAQASATELLTSLEGTIQTTPLRLII